MNNPTHTNHPANPFNAQENALKEYEEAYKKDIGIGVKLDILLTIIRISIFFNDLKNTKKYLEQARTQMEKGGDWERKNKLKIYEALNYIMIRNFPEASKILIDAASTFTATEIISYDDIIFYVVILGIVRWCNIAIGIGRTGVLFRLMCAQCNAVQIELVEKNAPAPPF